MPGSPDNRWDGLLGSVAAAAHRALVRMEDDDVPQALKAVRAASVKRTLPAPFRRTLVDHLEHEWLRDLALAEVDEQADEVARLFLSRPDGWAERLDAIFDERNAEAERRSNDALETEIDRVRRVNEELSARVRDAESRAAEAERRLADDTKADAARQRLEDARQAIQTVQSDLSEARERIARLERDLSEADERIALLRSRDRKKGEQSPGRPGTRTFGRGNPIEAARMLDELAEALRPGAVAEVEPAEREQLRLPAGVRPDSAAAIEWIRTVDRRVLVVVDGHNVAHDLSPEPGRTTRDRIVSEMARLRRLSDGPVSVLVYFDTGAESETHRQAGVTVRYVNDADSAIEETAASSSVDCIVISTDKEVRARARRHGALALWGTALSAWIRRG